MKNKSTRILIGMISLALLVPSSVFAQVEIPRVDPKKVGDVDTGSLNRLVCDRITTYSGRLINQVVEGASKIDKTRKNSDLELQARQAERDQRLFQNRTEYDANRKEQIAKLEERATTTGEKEAVKAFEIAVENAVAARRSAIDNALSAFRDGLMKGLEERKSAVTRAVEKFKKSVEQAVAKAKADCASGVDPKTVRDTYTRELKAAQSAFENDRKLINKIEVDVGGLKATRKASIDKAFADFKAAIEKAGKDLKKVLGK